VAFLGEPFEGVDPISSKNIKEAILLASGQGCTFFITSHSLEIMERINDSLHNLARRNRLSGKRPLAQSGK
jgi:ABC-type multidrug transport system ATPase subunit